MLRDLAWLPLPIAADPLLLRWFDEWAWLWAPDPPPAAAGTAAATAGTPAGAAGGGAHEVGGPMRRGRACVAAQHTGGELRELLQAAATPDLARSRPISPDLA